MFVATKKTVKAFLYKIILYNFKRKQVKLIYNFHCCFKMQLIYFKLSPVGKHQSSIKFLPAVKYLQLLENFMLSFFSILIKRRKKYFTTDSIYAILIKKNT